METRWETLKIKNNIRNGPANKQNFLLSLAKPGIFLKP
jgi:hypothetical protein